MNAIEYVKKWESGDETPTALYICPAGYPTIGDGIRVTDWSVRDLAEYIYFHTGAPTLGLPGLLATYINDHFGDWLTEADCTPILQRKLEQCVLDLIDAMGAERWRALDMVVKAEATPWERDEVWTLGEEVTFASPRQCALIDLTYNMGHWWHEFPKCWQAVLVGGWPAASKELLFDNAYEFSRTGPPPVLRVSDYARQVGRRAEVNAEMLRTGEEAAAAIA